MGVFSIISKMFLCCAKPSRAIENVQNTTLELHDKQINDPDSQKTKLEAAPAVDGYCNDIHAGQDYCQETLITEGQEAAGELHLVRTNVQHIKTNMEEVVKKHVWMRNSALKDEFKDLLKSGDSGKEFYVATANKLQDHENPSGTATMVVYYEKTPSSGSRFMVSYGLRVFMSLIQSYKLDAKGKADMTAMCMTHEDYFKRAFGYMLNTINVDELKVHAITLGYQFLSKTSVMNLKANVATLNALEPVVQYVFNGWNSVASKCFDMSSVATKSELYLIATVGEDGEEINPDASELNTLIGCYAGMRGGNSRGAAKHDVPNIDLGMNDQVMAEISAAADDGDFYEICVAALHEIATSLYPRKNPQMPTEQVLRAFIKSTCENIESRYLPTKNWQELFLIGGLNLGLYRVKTDHFNLKTTGNHQVVVDEASGLFTAIATRYPEFGEVEIIGEVTKAEEVAQIQHLFPKLLVPEVLVSGLQENPCTIVYSGGNEDLRHARKTFRCFMNGRAIFDLVMGSNETPPIAAKKMTVYELTGVSHTFHPTSYVPLSQDYDWKQPKLFKYETPLLVAERNRKMAQLVDDSLKVYYSKSVLPKSALKTP